jgi:putative oxidoreductase
MRFLERFNEPIYALFRIVFGLMFASHGAQKVFGWFGATTKADAPLTIAAGWLEIVLGLLIAVGLFVGIAALIAAVEMAIASILAQGEASVLYCFAFLYMASRESGRWSVDHLRRKPSAP